MLIISTLRLALGIVFLIIGVCLFAIQIYGVFKFRYVLNRMHAAAMGDTLGIGSCLLGLMILSGWNFTTCKLGLVILFLWCSSPVSSHLISKLQAVTDTELDQRCEITEEVHRKVEKLAENGEEV